MCPIVTLIPRLPVGKIVVGVCRTAIRDFFSSSNIWKPHGIKSGHHQVDLEPSPLCGIEHCHAEEWQHLFVVGMLIFYIDPCILRYLYISQDCC